MNHIYRLVFNRRKGIVQVISERGSVQGKGTSARRTFRRIYRRTQSPLAAAIAVTLGLGGLIPSHSALAVTVTGKSGTAGTTTSGGTGYGSGSYVNSGGAPGVSVSNQQGSNGQGANNSGGQGGIYMHSGTYSRGGTGGYGGGTGGSANHLLSGGGGAGGNLKTNGYGGGGGGSAYSFPTSSSTSGGGGGGGSPATTFTATQTINGTYSGGSGGAGAGTGGYYGGGGGGGAGAILKGGFTLTNNGSITGGAGGAGGAGGGGGGGLLMQSNSMLINNGTITGGAGGAGVGGGSAGVNFGSGGAGIAGSGLTITNSGTISGGMSDNGTIRADAMDFTGGSNTLTLSGSSWVLNGNINVASGASLTFNQSTNQTLSNKITGAGSIIQNGTGTLILNGANAYSGATTVSAGTLEIGDASHGSASITSNVAVNSGGTLRGHGTITGNVNNSGTVYPGGSIGILHVSGNYTQSASGTLNIEVTPNVSAGAGVGYDQLNVTGTVALAGTLNVQADTGTYTVGSKYDIVHSGTANGLSGTFATTTLGGGYGSYLTASLSYTGTDAYLTLSPKSGANNSLGPAFTTGQGVAVGDFTTVNSLFSSLDALLNVQGGTAGGILKVNGQPDPGVWVRGLRGFGSAYGAGLSNHALLAGYGDEVQPGLIIGAAVANTQSRTQSDVQRVDTHTNGLSGYTLYNQGPLILGASISAGRLDTSSYRTLTSINKVATGSAGGWYGDLAGKAGWRLTRGQAFLVPSVSASYLHTHRNAYTESGAGSLDLAYSAATYDIGAFSAGFRAGEDLHTGSNLTVSPWLGLGAVAYVGDRKQNLPVTLGTTQESLATTAAPAKAALVNAGLALMSRGNWSGQLVYHGQFSDHTHMNTADLKVVYRW